MEQNLKIQAGKWFEATVVVKKLNENGDEKMVKEQYAVNEASFTGVEATLYVEIAPEDVVAEKFAPFKEVVVSDKDEDDQWFKVKVDIIIVDEKTSKEKHTKITYLVNASTVNKARSYMDNILSDSMLDYSISDINKTKIIDIINNG